MPGNTPNVSRNTFDVTKEYQRVSIQQGVPVMDADLNELQDNLRIWIQLLSEYFIGTFRVGTGFGFGSAAVPTNQNFNIGAGWAMVEGAMISTTKADPPADVEYIDDENYIVEGTVTGIDGATNKITDVQQKFQAFMDLVATANHGACYVLMTSGAESGNTFDITGYTSTTLTLGAGIGAIGVGDTFIVKPPVLTVPGAFPQTDTGYIMAWWEDIAEEEDSAITDPFSGIETAHRSKLRWTVRVIENTTTIPSTPTSFGFGVRYLKSFEFTRGSAGPLVDGLYGHSVAYYNTGKSLIDHINDAGDPHSITASQVAFTPVGILSSTNVQSAFSELLTDLGNRAGQDIGINTDFANGTLTDTGAGGLGDLDPGTLQDAIARIDETVVRRRAFTAVLTHGATSVGGDYDSTDSVDHMNDFTNGVFFLRRGSYTWNAIAALAKDVWVCGESKDSCSVYLPVGTSSDFEFDGKWSRVTLKSLHSSYKWKVDYISEVILEDVAFDSGAFRIVGGNTTMRNVTMNSTSISTEDYGLEIIDYNPTYPPRGYFENCHFSGPSSSAITPEALIYIQNISATAEYEEGLYFKDCRFSAVGDTYAVQIVNVFDMQVTFDNCSFDSDSDRVLIYLSAATNVRFVNCQFNNASGALLDVRNSGVVFMGCFFRCGDVTTGSTLQALTYYGCTPFVMRDCEISIGDSIVKQPGTSPWIEFGARAGTGTGNPCQSIIDGLLVVLDPSIPNLPGNTPIVMYGPAVEESRLSVNDMVFDTNNNEPSATRLLKGKVNNYGSWVDIVGDSGFARPSINGLAIVNCDGASSSVTTLGNILAAEFASLRRVSIDCAAAPLTSTLYIGGVWLEEGVEAYELEFSPNGYVPTVGSDIHIGSDCHVYSGQIRSIYNNAGKFFIIEMADFASLHDFLVRVTPNAATALITVVGMPSNLVIDRCDFKIDSAVARTVTEVSLGLTDQCRFTNNRYWANVSSGKALIMAGRGCLSDSNVFMSTSGTTPSITNSDITSVTGDDVYLSSAT